LKLKKLLLHKFQSLHSTSYNTLQREFEPNPFPPTSGKGSGVTMNQQCPREIPLGNHFCRTHTKMAFAKKLLSSNEVVEEEEVEVEERKKRASFNKLPLKKREQEEDVDPDTKIIQLPQVEEEEDPREILANICRE